MKVVYCFWEKRNLGCNVAEVSVESTDHFDIKDLEDFSCYDYVVVKVPANKMDFNFGLSQLGYSMIELQMEMQVKIKDFNYDHKNLRLISEDVDFQQIKTEDELNDILSKLTTDMFTTDRIHIDPYFGPELSRIRYVNWLKDEFERNSSVILKLFYKGMNVGFSMFRGESNIRGLLGGIYAEYQSLGLGALTTCSLPLYIKKKNLNVKRILGDISSNNIPVWVLYEFFGYRAFNPRYVFVKHNHITNK